MVYLLLVAVGRVRLRSEWEGWVYLLRISDLQQWLAFMCRMMSLNDVFIPQQFNRQVCVYLQKNGENLGFVSRLDL